MKNIAIERFEVGHPLYSAVAILHDGITYLSVFGQCIDDDTKEFLDYTLERKDTLIAEGKYEFDYYFSPANGMIIPRLTIDPNGVDISARELEHHPANWAFQLKGCCAHGLKIDTHTPALATSRTAIEALMKHLNGECGTITYRTFQA